MKDGICILSFIGIGLLWPTYLERRTRGSTFVMCWAAPAVAFYLGWWAR
ncbi:hypothetical protein BLA6863_00175 [Burkholderia lata]|uniref:Uncharacterized protein n=1 Tax=Burkholderia lata (strain ATCC 17760 / DSM 23089 / LMG 22485 / NCIMB 9086 / R18194 / 383) TaxID=482957 RepID=A0A6P2GW40_BURL3|nr:hypothetical protein BLA6863_00175 [Burkholderia lata]